MSGWPKHDYRDLRRRQGQDAARVVLDDDRPQPLRTIGAFDAAYADRRGFGALVVAELPAQGAGAGAPPSPPPTSPSSPPPSPPPSPPSSSPSSPPSSPLRSPPSSPSLAPEPRVIVEEAEVTFPYVPGFLAYREMPMFDAVMAAVRRQETPVPDIVIVDGSGLLHPSRFGQACHFGVRHDIPTIGVSKRLFVGEVQGEVADLAPGQAMPVHWEGELCGYALRIGQRSKKPVFVSPGHRCSPTGALAAVRTVTSPAHRLPWPQQMAHEAAGAARAKAQAGMAQQEKVEQEKVERTRDE